MKQSLNILSDILISLGDLYQDGMYTTAGVLVQNMAFNADVFTEEEFDPYLSILSNMKKYNDNNHVLKFAYDESYLLIQGYFRDKDSKE